MSNATAVAQEGPAKYPEQSFVAGDAQTSRRGRTTSDPNMGKGEAWASAALGSALVWRALRRPTLGSLPLAAVGAALVYRGSTRSCPAYAAVGIDRSKRKSGPDAVGAVTVNKPPEEVYRFWRDLSNLPRFMSILESVEVLDETRSRWRTRELGGRSFRYEAEITEDTPNDGIRWKSVSGSPIEMRGTVRFKPAPAGRGTIVIGSLIFGRGPGGGIAGRIASPFARYVIHEDLMRLKQLLEAGEIATTEDQSVGPRDLDSHRMQRPNAEAAYASPRTQEVSQA